MKRNNAMQKMNAGYIAQCVPHGSRENVSILGHDSRRDWMKFLFAAALVICFTAQSGEAFAYACNNNHYVNSSGHLIHSPSCGEERGKRMAECRDGSVSFSEHLRGTARITVALHIGIELLGFRTPGYLLFVGLR